MTRDYYRTAIGFTEAILAHMETTGVTRAELARRTGVTPATVTHWLSADRNLTLRTMVKIATAVGVTVKVELVSP
jgi:transcriptional regulator with XRE-family HTH domain